MSGSEVAAVESAAEVSEGVGVTEVDSASEAVVEGGEAADVEVDAIAEAEGWSVESSNAAVTEALSPTSLETTPLMDSTGEIAEYVRPEEAAHYESIGLEPEQVAGRESLVRNDIDWSQEDVYGMSNLERAESGRAPLDPSGESYELHHVQQRNDGLLAELRCDEHRGKEIDGLLHDKVGPSEIDRDAFSKIRADHWRERAASVRASGGVA